jgi:hypothetical protein
MPTFPKKLGPEVRNIPAGTPYQNFPIPPGAFGIDSGVEDLGKGLTKGSEAIFSAVASELSDEHSRIAKEKENELRQRIRLRLYGDGTNENPGYFGLSGSAAVDNHPLTQQGIQKDYDDILNSIGSNNIRRIFQTAANDRLSTVGSQVGRHLVTHRKVAQLETSQARQTEAVDDARLAYNDPETVSKSLSAVRGEVFDQARIQGWSPEVIDTELDKAQTVLFSAMIKDAMKRGDTSSAVALLRKHSTQMDPGAVAALEQDLKKPKLIAKAQNEVETRIHSMDYYPDGRVRKEKRTRAKILSTARAELSGKPDLRDEVIARLNKRFDETDELEKEEQNELRGKWHRLINSGKETLESLQRQFPEEWKILAKDVEDVKALNAAQKNITTRKEYALNTQAGLEGKLTKMDKETLARQDGEIYKSIMDRTTWGKWFGPTGKSTAARAAIEAKGESGAFYDRMRKALADLAPADYKLFKSGQSTTQRDIQKQILQETDKWILEKITAGEAITEQEIRAQAALVLQPIRKGGVVGDILDFLDIGSGISAAEARATYSDVDKRNVRVDFDEIPSEWVVNIKSEFMKKRDGRPGFAPSEEQIEQYMGAFLMKDTARMNRLLGVGKPARSPLQ